MDFIELPHRSKINIPITRIKIRAPFFMTWRIYVLNTSWILTPRWLFTIFYWDIPGKNGNNILLRPTPWPEVNIWFHFSVPPHGEHGGVEGIKEKVRLIYSVRKFQLNQTAYPFLRRSSESFFSMISACWRVIGLELMCSYRLGRKYAPYL